MKDFRDFLAALFYTVLIVVIYAFLLYYGAQFMAYVLKVAA